MSLIQNRLKYFITDIINGRWEATPLGEQKLQLSYDKSDNLKFAYQKKISGKLRFVGQDYKRLKQLEAALDCKLFPIEIQEQINGAWQIAQVANLYLNKGEWDDAKCFVEIELVVISVEKNIENAADVDLFKQIPAAERVVVSTKNKFIITTGVQWTTETYVVTDQTRDTRDMIQWRPPAGKGSVPIYQQPDYCGYGDFYRKYDEDGGPKGYYWFYNVSAGNDNSYTVYGCVSNGQWAGSINGVNQYRPKPLRTNEVRYMRFVAWIGESDPTPANAIDLNEHDIPNGKRKVARLPTFENWYDGVTGQQVTDTANWPPSYKDDCDKMWVRSRLPKDPPPNEPGTSETATIIDNGVLLSKALSVLLTPFELSVKSRFFNINSDYAIDSETNYVTRESSTTASIVIWQKSDVKRASATNNASIFLISPKTLIESLCNMFNCRWGVEGDNLVIEHVSYFRRQGLMDLSNKRELKGINSYSYISDTFPGKEVFTFMDKSPEVYAQSDFNGVPIVYNNNCDGAGADDVNYPAEKVSTDVAYLIKVGNDEIRNADGNNEPASSQVSDNGFVVGSVLYSPDGFSAVTDSGPVTLYYSFITKSRILDEYDRVNNPFGWAHLHNDFWKYDRYLSQGLMNNKQTQFITTKPNRQSPDLSFIYCDPKIDFDPSISFMTVTGVGDADSATVALATGLMKLKLNYTDFDPTKWDGIIYASMERIPLDPIVNVGECVSDPGNIREIDRDEMVKIRINFFMDQYGQVPYIVKTWDNISVVIMGGSNVNPPLHIEFTINAVAGQTYAESDPETTYHYHWDCNSNAVGSQYHMAYYVGSIVGATLLNT